MTQGRFANVLVGAAIALLPLYIRISTVDMQRTSKDNLLIIIFMLIGFILPSKVRSLGKYATSVIFLAFFALVVNQHNVLSLNVLMQMIYIGGAIAFFVHYYEKHDRNSLEHVLSGMRIGCLIQSVLGIFGYFAINLYPHFVALFVNFNVSSHVQGGFNNVIGTLGNSNLLGSYVAITGLSFLNAKRKYLIILPIICLILAKSMMGLAAFGAGLFYYFNSKYKWQIYLASMVGMISLPFLNNIIKLSIDSGRFGAWGKILSIVDVRHFLIGRGPGWFPDQVLIIGEGVFFQQEHNAFLSLFNVFGMLGVLLLLPIFINFLKQKDHTPVFSAILFAAFCNSYGHFTLNQSTVVIIIIVALAVCLPNGAKNVINVQR
jgi:hypothetical protein